MLYHTSSFRMGFSLVEVILATSILAVIIAMVGSTMTAASNYATLGSAQDDLDAEASRVLRAIGDELSMSAWYFSPTSADAIKSATTLTADRQTTYFPMVVQQPTAAGGSGGFPATGIVPLLAPFQRAEAMIVPTFFGLNLREREFLAGIERGAGAALAPADVTLSTARALKPGTTYYRNSFFARSQELVYLRASIGSMRRSDATLGASPTELEVASWLSTGIPTGNQTAAPSARGLPVLDFSGSPAAWNASGNHVGLKILYPSAYRVDATQPGVFEERAPGVAYGIPMDAGYLTTVNNGDLSIQLQWDGNVPLTYGATAFDETNLRRYACCVVPSSNGLGSLVLTYTTTSAAPMAVVGKEIKPGMAIAQSGAMNQVVDRVLSNNVTRIVFETSRHVQTGNADAAYGINGVRVTLFMAKLINANSQGGGVISRRVTAMLSMRATASSADKSTAEKAMPNRISFEY